MNFRRAFPWLTVLASLLPAMTQASEKADLQQELKVLERGEKLQRRIPDAKFRVAVFTYEDPNNTKLGDSLATLIGRQLLVRSAVSSFGVVTYAGGLAPDESSGLSYFDKVEKVSEAQDVTMSIWGMVRRRGSTLTIDTYVQLPRALVENTLVWRVRLPARMKGELVAHLRPERILAQRLELPVSAANAISAAALRSNELRADTADTAAVVNVMANDKIYWMEKSQGDWILMSAGAGQGGWVRASGGCDGVCAPVLDAADAGAALLAFLERRTLQRFPDNLSPDVQAIRDQLEAYELIDSRNVPALRFTTERIGEQLRKAESSARVPPGGAGLANAWMIDSLVLQLQSEASGRAREAGGADILPIYQELEPDRAQVGAMAFQLAEASVSDPDNADVLHNLAVLFEYAGDEKRASLARSLAEQAPR